MPIRSLPYTRSGIKGKSMLVEICLPVKDEEKILAANLQQIIDFCVRAGFSFDWKIIGLVNGSADSTAAIFAGFKDRYPEIVDYMEITASGKGRAIREYWAISRADILSYMDIDLAVLPGQLPELFGPIFAGEADLVIGSRLSAGACTNRSWRREITSRAFNVFARLIFRDKVSDRQCGFKAVSAAAYRRIAPFLEDDYWLFDSELIAFSNRLSYRLQEIPVDWDENRYQKRASKVSIIGDLRKSIIGMFRLHRRLYSVLKK